MDIENSDQISDEAVARRVQEANVQEFGILVERYERKISRYARKFLSDQEEIKDIVQDVFLKAFENIQSFDATRRFSPWIYRIAHNEFINAIKKKTTSRIFSLFDFDTLLPQPAARETADGPAQKEQMKSALEKGLGALDPKYREVLVLYYYEEMDYKEISDILHIPVSTVGVRLRRGKEKMKKVASNLFEHE